MAGMVEVKVAGLAKLERFLDGKLILQPEIEPALDSVAKRWLRKGKGLGEQRNTLSVAAEPLSRSLSTTLRAPRTTGGSRRQANVRRYLPPVIRNAVLKMARGIAARASAAAGGN